MSITKDSIRDRHRTAPHDRRRWRDSAAAAGILLIAGVMWIAGAPPAALVRWWNPNSRPELKPLVAAVGASRPVAGRLTGGFAWGPLAAPTRGGSARRAELPPDVHIAAALLARVVAAGPSAAARADSATGLLVLGRTDDAIDALEAATEERPEAPQYWSDLAAAYLERFRSSGRSTDLPRALDAIERALVLERLPEALFNRALILEGLNLAEPATRAWQDYLTADGASPWAAETRQRLNSLRQAAEKSADNARTQTLRERVTDDILAQWAASPDQTEAARLLAEASRADRQLTLSSPDRLVTDIIASIEASAKRPVRAQALREAHAAYGRARAAYRKDAHAEADVQFAVAERRGGEGGSALSLLARLYRGIIRYRLSDLPATTTELNALLRDLPAGGTYPSLHGRISWTLGLMSALRGRHREAVAYYHTATASLETADERPNVAFVETLRAAQLDNLGDVEGAWQARIAVFPLIDRESPIQSAAQSAARAGWWRTSGTLLDIVASMARSKKRDIVVADALRSRARAFALAGAPDAGLAAIAEARRLASAHAEAAWHPIRAEIDLADAECNVTRSPATALEAATRALDYFKTDHRDVRLPDVYLVRARAYVAAGQPSRAEEDLVAGIDVLDRLRGQIDEWQLRALFGDAVQRLGDELVTLRVRGGRTDEALDAAARLRGLGSARPASPRATQPPRRTVAGIAKALPADAVMGWFFVGVDETYLWVIRPAGMRFVRIPVTRERLTRLVQSQPATDAGVARELRALLLTPLDAELAAADRFVIVPDGPLHLLPFAALPGRTARFLIEEETLLFNPTPAGSDGHETKVMNGKGHTPAIAKASTPAAADRALIIGSPSFDRQAFAGLAGLPESGPETAALAEIYDRTTVLTGAGATRAAILQALPSHAIFHFAGHSFANDVAPGQSALVVAGTASEVITAIDVSRLHLANVRLVMLSSCEGVIGTATRSEGPIGLARAFLNAGALAIVASQTPVDDRAARALSTIFHHEYRRTGDAAASLRHAQRTLLRSPVPVLAAPEHWATFVVVGAG